MGLLELLLERLLERLLKLLLEMSWATSRGPSRGPWWVAVQNFSILQMCLHQRSTCKSTGHHFFLPVTLLDFLFPKAPRWKDSEAQVLHWMRKHVNTETRVLE
jgi:hypothetical protein